MGNEDDQKHMNNFVDCVRSRREPNCPAGLGYEPMTSIELSVRSPLFDLDNAKILNF